MKPLLAAVFLSLLGLAATAAAQPAPPASAQTQEAVIDLNRASAEELASLKGIGPVRAAAIVAGRPYARKDELVRRRIIPESVYADIRERVVARQ